MPFSLQSLFHGRNERLVFGHGIDVKPTEATG